jgi:hypothetical protein
MTDPHASNPFRADAAFTAAAERFYELLKTFGAPAAAAAGHSPDWTTLAAPLAGQFEQWLKMSQFGGPWSGTAAPGGVGHGFEAASPAWLFGGLPLGPAAAPAGEARHTFELLGKLAQLQAQLAVHWGEVAQSAARGFVARMGAQGGSRGTPADALRLYELWVECAEEAYGATVRKAEFCRLQAELANTSAALLVEQRRQAESLVRAFGLPTRSEVDALYAQLQELRQRFGDSGAHAAAQADEPAGAATPAPRAARSKPARRVRPRGKRRSGRGTRG